MLHTVASLPGTDGRRANVKTILCPVGRIIVEELLVRVCPKSFTVPPGLGLALFDQRVAEMQVCNSSNEPVALV